MTIGPQRRIRFSGAQRIHLDGEKCSIRIRLQVASSGAYVVGVADGGSSLEDQLTTAGEATLNALRKTVGGEDIKLELTEVTTFDAFNKSGVMVSLMVKHQKTIYRLTGFSQVGELKDGEGAMEVQVDVARRKTSQVANVAQAVALAVLSATNRVLAVG